MTRGVRKHALDPAAHARGEERKKDLRHPTLKPKKENSKNEGFKDHCEQKLVSSFYLE